MSRIPSTKEADKLKDVSQERTDTADGRAGDWPFSFEKLSSPYNGSLNYRHKA